MNIFFIPSWYPSSSDPLTGIFFKEQIELFGAQYPSIQCGVSLWGSHEPSLLIDFKSGILNIPKITRAKRKKGFVRNDQNVSTFYTPALTWTRRFKKGNINGIIRANQKNLDAFKSLFGKPDLMVAFVSHPAGVIAHALSVDNDIPFIISEHMSPFPHPTYQNEITFLKTPLSAADAIISVSQHLRNEIKEKVAISSKVIPNFIDDSFFKIQKKPSPYPLTAVAIGRFVNQKAFEVLIESIGYLNTNDLNVAIYGEGPLRSRLSNQVKKLALANKVTIGNTLSRDEVRDKIQGSDFLIVSSRHESFGIIILEAIACGKPVVATACGGPEEIINKNNGLLAIPGDPADLANKIDQMVNSIDSYDSVLIRKDFEERFSARVVTDKLKQLYEEVIQSHL